MMISWVTMAASVKSVVEYGERCKLPLNKRAFGEATKYKACGWKERIIHMHRAKLEGLVPGRGYGKGFSLGPSSPEFVAFYDGSGTT